MMWSLRLSERGLKFEGYEPPKQEEPSLRSSERGLKLRCQRSERTQMRSLRSSERGLKYLKDLAEPSNRIVAPFVGAWIEIA